MPSRCCCSISPGCCCSTQCCGCRGCCRSIRRASAPSPPDLAFNTAASFTTNTNWQNYGGEIDALLSHPDGRADGAQLRLGSDRHGARHRAGARLCAAVGLVDRQLLGRPHTRHALRAVADVGRDRAGAGLAGDAAEPLRLCRRHDARRRHADHRARAGRQPGGDQDARHERRRLLQRQRRASLREPDAALQLDPDVGDLCARRGAHQHLWPHGRQRAPGLGDLRRDGRALRGRRQRRLLGGSLGQSGPDRARPRPCRRQHGRQGGPLRHRRLGALRGNHDGRILRRGQRHARQLHRARRHDPLDQHGARRGHRRRRRRRPLRHAALRHRRGLRRRADGRANAGISRQEDRGARGQDDDARAARPAALDARLHGARRDPADGRVEYLEPRSARLLRGALRLYVGHGEQRLGLRRPDRQHARSTIRRWRSRC